MAATLKALVSEFKEITSPREVIRTVEISVDDIYRIEVYERHEDFMALDWPFGVETYRGVYMSTERDEPKARVWARDPIHTENYSDADTALRAALRALADRAVARKSN